MARDIPGFYYDEEKGKYFRIQQSHRIVAGTGYTKQSIKAAEQIKQDENHLKRQIKRQRAGKIVRSRLLLNTTSPLSARLGANPEHNKTDILRQYGAGLSSHSVDGCGSESIEDTGFLGTSFCITHSGILRAYYKPYPPNVNQLDDISDRSSLSIFNHYRRTPVVHNVIASVYESSGLERGVISSDGSPVITIKPVDANGTLEPLYIEMNVATWGVETIWDIATSNFTPRMALATDSGLMVGHCRENNVTSIMGVRDLARKEQMNVCFKDSNIVMSGERSGRISFSDARTGHSVVRLLHSSAVLGTVALRDANHVLAHGYTTTSTYDLRWVQQVPVAKKARSNHTNQHSQSYINFAVPRNRHTDHYTRGRKVAYSKDLDLVIAASADSFRPAASTFVTLYSAKTGRVVDSPLTRHEYASDVTCLDLRRVRDGPESVFCLSGNHLDEWAVGTLSADEMRHYGMEREGNVFMQGDKHRPKMSFEQEWDRGNSLTR